MVVANSCDNIPMLQLGTLEFDCPAVMGVLNVTPDSFSDGGRFVARDAALREAESMAAAGAAIIDIGGESTRPGAGSVNAQQELDRILPVIEAIRGAVDTPISVDTSKPDVMRAAVAALQADGALQAAIELKRPVCLMHMQGMPRTMQNEPTYDDIVVEVGSFLRQRVAQCRDAGLDQDLIVIDPGFGFGKTHSPNTELLANLRQLQDIGRPLLVGLSRKSMLGELTGRNVDERLPASISAAVLAVMHGAQIVRAHDVAATVDALRVADAVMEAGERR